MISLEPRKMVAFASMLNCSGPRIHAPTQRGGPDIHTTHKPVFGMDSKMYLTYGDNILPLEEVSNNLYSVQTHQIRYGGALIVVVYHNLTIC